jgi:hypothetical protein
MKNCSCLFLLFFLRLGVANAQLNIVNDDIRIKKFNKEIIKYLSDHIQGIKIADSVGTIGNGTQIDIKRRLEIFSDSLNKDILLIQFFMLADHAYPYWGILTGDNHYFFYDTDDTEELELQAFIKKYDRASVETVISYCNYFPSPDYGGLPVGIALYDDKLDLIKKYIDKIEAPPVDDVKSAVSFLTEITGIKPFSQVSQSAQLNLSRNDYTKWLHWLDKNNLRLYWDSKERKVKVKK